MTTRHRDGRSTDTLDEGKHPQISEAVRVRNASASTLADLSDDTVDTLVGRAEAARFLGVSDSTVRRLEHTELPPIVENGVHRHSLRRLREFGLRRARCGGDLPTGRCDGEIAGEAFGLFEHLLRASSCMSGPDRICSTLEISLDDYLIARNSLIAKDLIAFDGTRLQVLSLPAAPVFVARPPLVTYDDFEQHDPATVRRAIRASYHPRTGSHAAAEIGSVERCR